MTSAATERCSQCGTLLTGAGVVEGVCSGCLLSLGTAAPTKSGTPERPTPEPAGADPFRYRRKKLEPIGSGVVAPFWAMPAELLRQASRRLRFAALGLGLGLMI